MPPFTKLRDFVDALSTGDTNITRVLQKLANDKGLRNDQQAIDDIQRPNSFDRLPAWFIAQCRKDMKQAEIDHIGGWPAEEKEAIRDHIASAWSSDTEIRFSWELHAGSDRGHEVRSDPDETVRVVFLSPRGKLRLSTKPGEVDVDL